MPIAQPDTHARLEAAALDLFAEKGYDDTTVLDIVQRAGVARRTFFRYFESKREVLFWGTAALQEAYADAVAAAPPDSSPLQMAQLALLAAADLQGGGRRDVVRRRQRIVDANIELQERQLLKRSRRSDVLTRALIRRGVDPLRAAVTSEAATGAYGIAFRRLGRRRVRRPARVARRGPRRAVDDGGARRLRVVEAVLRRPRIR